MDNLAVKTVDFMGDRLLAAKDNEGIIWTGVNSFCQGIGLNKSQRDTQVQNIQADEVLRRGCLKFQAGVFEPNNITLALQLDYVPLWLAKISITPNMKETNPELVEKLVKYQLKARNVLAEAFLPQAHNVKQLTITSRDIATMTTGKNLHGKVLANIRDCIAELEEMGFNVKEFFILDSYIGANNQQNPQYICTERGCEYYSGKLELEKRKLFLEEITDRFERMRNVLEGKPTKKLPKLICMADVEEKEPQIQLYKTDSGGIVLLDGEIYSLAADEIEALSRFIPEMQKSNIGKTQYIVSAFLRSMKKSGKLEEIASWGIGKEREPQQEEKIKKKSVTLDLSQVLHLTMSQAQQRYGMGRTNLMNAVEAAGGKFKNGNRILINREIMDKYFERQTKK